MADEKSLSVIIEEHGKHIKELKANQVEHHQRIEQHSDHITKLDKAMKDLDARFNLVATRTDIQALNTKIDQSFNGLLKDAMGSIPPKVLYYLMGFIAFISALSFLGHLIEH